MINVDINKRSHKNDFTMSDLHSHPFYEIYYLSKGSRLFFFKNSMNEISDPTLIIIPPHTLHKTEGGPFTRYNILVSPKNLDIYQTNTLEKYKLLILKPTAEENLQFTKILEEACTTKSKKYKQYISDSLFSYFIVLLNKIDVKVDNKTTFSEKPIPATVLKVMAYMQEHFSENISLDFLAKEFYISKFTLNYNFKKYASCTPIEYLLGIRLTKAKELLLTTKKNIDEISEICGFSSPNYFGVIFKKFETVSPTTYRRTTR